MSLITRSQEKKNKNRIRANLREYKISFKSIEERSGELRPDGKTFHRNTICAAFNAYNEYYNDQLILLADKMIQEKKILISQNGV